MKSVGIQSDALYGLKVQKPNVGRLTGDTTKSAAGGIRWLSDSCGWVW